jgi:hypothetical protein
VFPEIVLTPGDTLGTCEVAISWNCCLCLDMVLNISRHADDRAIRCEASNDPEALEHR